MHRKLKVLFGFALLAGIPLPAQEWELGVLGGYGYLRSLSVTSPAGTAKAGFQHGPAVGVYAAHHPRARLSGEFHYLYRGTDLKLSMGSTKVTFSGDSHAVHYDVVWHTRPKGAPVRPFLIGGGGVKVYRGTDAESSFQPLNQFALLTKTSQTLPLLTVGAGLRMEWRRNLQVRVEFRDYITTFPTQVIAPAPRAKLSGWLHDFLPAAGIGLTF